MKTCFKCKGTYPLDEFYPHKRMKDGHLNKCKSCTKKDEKRYRALNPDKIRLYEKERFKNPERKKLAAKVSSVWRKKYPEKSRAQSTLWKAIIKGTIKRRNCEKCGAQKAHAHHPDYTKPLKVLWLCPLHHKEQHKIESLRGNYGQRKNNR